MVVKPGEKLSATWRDDARAPTNWPEPSRQSADEAVCCEFGQRPSEEIQSPREGQKNTEHDSEARFRAVFENAAVGIARVAPDGVWLEVNQRLCDIVGYSREELMTKTFTDITHPDDVKADLIGSRRMLAGEIDTYLREKRYYRKDGSVVWINLTVSLARKADGSPDYFITVVEDISARKRAEEALRESEQRFAGFMRHLPGLAWIKDLQGRYVYANATAVKAFRTPLEELYGRTDDEVFPPEVAAQFKENDQRALTNEAGIFVVETLEHEDGVLHYSAVRKFLIPSQDVRGINIGGIAIDITESKQADEALRESEERLAGIVSSAMDAIIIERSAKAQLQIIEDLLDSARIITGKLRIELEPIDLVPVLEAALDTVRPMAEAKGVSLAANFGPAPEETLGDSTRLQQVVWNLLTNAVKFSPEGGRVELRMESDTDNVRITVSDTGKGIEPEFLPFVFDPFRQADSSSVRRYGGLGLGLSLVKHLVELHGGTITASSEGSTHGSTFTVTLPRRQLEFIAPPTPAVTPREVRTEGAIPLDQALSLEGVSVLVVDDQEEARVVLTQTLSEYGAQVTAVSSGAEALALLSHPPGGRRPDALILDIAMPDEDGYAVLKKVRGLDVERGGAADQIPAIALTAYGRSEDRLSALQAGFHMHIAKPVEPAELAVVIASLITRRAWERERDRKDRIV